MSVSGGNLYTVNEVLYEDFPPTDTQGSAMLIQNDDSLVIIKKSTFKNCSSITNGGAFYLQSSNTTILLCNFGTCQTSERGGCTYTLSPVIRVSDVSSVCSFTGLHDSVYLKKGVLDVKYFNESDSEGNISPGMYVVESKEKSIVKFITSHHTKADACSGWSTLSNNVAFSKCVITDSIECIYVFYIVNTNLEVEEIYLWNVPKKTTQSYC